MKNLYLLAATLLVFSLFLSISCGKSKSPDVSNLVPTQVIHGIIFISIPGETFQIVDVDNAGYSDEKPVYTVRVSSFQMSETEITNAQYCSYLNA